MVQTNQRSRWTQEQLAHACEVHAPVGDAKYGAKVHLIPMFLGSRGIGYGSEISWDKRLLRKGGFGPQDVNVDTLMAVGCSEDEAVNVLAQVDNAMDFLKRAYPALQVGMGEKLRGLEVGLKAALPAGHEATREKFEV